MGKISKVVTTLKNPELLQQPAWHARFTRRNTTSKRFENQKLSQRYKRARYYHAQLGRFISRDPLGFVDGMSLYRAYFIPGGMDPLGNSLVFQQVVDTTNVLWGKCVDRCIHHIMIFHRETYDDDFDGVVAACEKWCRKNVPPKPPVVIPGPTPPWSIDISLCTPWRRKGAPTWSKWKLIEKEGCVCKYEATGVQKWVRTCQLRTWDVANWDWSYGKKRSEYGEAPVRKTKEEYCD